MSSQNKIDMTSGPLFKKIWIFSIPLMASGILQLLYNAADIIVVGRAVGKSALAAVGCTAPMVNLIVNLFMGLSVGSSVLISQLSGAGRKDELPKAVHTSVAVSIIGGLAVGLIGFIAAKPLLTLMGTPETFIDASVLYVRIYFCGMPAIGVYNFTSAILRAVGDTKRPMIFLLISGTVNVVLNLFFVIVCGMSVEGVALATVISQCVAAALTVSCLIKSDDELKLHIKEIKITGKYLKPIASIGIPAGVQGAIFSLSNMLIQSSINSFGDTVVAGSSAGSSLDGFIYTALNGISQATITFTAQNAGAGKYERIRKVITNCLISILITSVVLGIIFIFAGRLLLSFYNKDPYVIDAGMVRLLWLAPTYFLCGFMEVFAGAIRGMGKSLLPTVVTLVGACGLRVLWLFTAFVLLPRPWVVYASYPISWLITAIAHACCFAVIYKKKILKTDEPIS